MRALLLAAVSMLLFLPGCFGDPGTGVFITNSTEYPLSVRIDTVGSPFPAQHTLVPSIMPLPKLKPGETRRLGSGISPRREDGIYFYYFFTVFSEDGAIVWQRVFTWDELNEMDWHVVIEEQSR